MKKLAFTFLEVMSLPALAMLFIVSRVGDGARNIGRFVTDTLEQIEKEIRRA